MNTLNGLINTDNAPTRPKSSKKQLKALNKPLTDNQFIRELDKLKIPRPLKKAMYAQRKAGGRA